MKNNVSHKYEKGTFMYELRKMFRPNNIKNMLLVVLGTIILAFGSGVFLVPFDLITGGMSGLGIILVKILPFNLSIDVYVAIISWALFFLGFIILGKDLALKTLISAIVYPVALSLSIKLLNSPIIGDFLDMKNGQYQSIAILLGSVFGGAMVGAGCAISFIGGGSTGGTDIIAFIICKYFKRLKSSQVIFIIDALIVVSGMFIINDLVTSLLGIVSAFLCAITIDKVFLSDSKAFIAFIVSDKYEEINRKIIKKLDRTSTIIDSMGGYLKQPNKVLMISFNFSQYRLLIDIINRIDKKAFITISRAHEINGEGWTYDKWWEENRRLWELQII